MRTPTNLVKRGGVYYFRKKAPAELRERYGSESIRKSLRDFPALADARREAARLAEPQESGFAALRASMAPGRPYR